MAHTLAPYLLVPLTLVALVSLAHGDDHGDDDDDDDSGVVYDAGADAEGGTQAPICVESYCGVNGDCLAPRDLVILVDSSGSLYDDEYNKWNAELSMARSLAASHPLGDTHTKVALINFSGCSRSFDFATCMESGRIVTEFGLISDPATIDNSIAQAEFHGGTTWTN